MTVDGFFRGPFCGDVCVCVCVFGGGGGGKITFYLERVRIKLETCTLVRECTHIRVVSGNINF